jgi:hypothetical protein
MKSSWWDTKSLEVLWPDWTNAVNTSTWSDPDIVIPVLIRNYLVKLVFTWYLCFYHLTFNFSVSSYLNFMSYNVGLILRFSLTICIFFEGGGTGVWSQGLYFLGRCSTTWVILPALFLCWVYFEIGSQELFAQAGLELWSSQTVPLE